MGKGQRTLNKIDNAEFLLGDASTIFEELVSADKTVRSSSTPREKDAGNFLKQTLAFRPERIIYVSCEPATQARGVGKLLEGDTAYLIASLSTCFLRLATLKTLSPWNSTNGPIG